MATSPTQNTLKELRKRGYRAAVVEKYNTFSKRSNDLFGFIDVLGIGLEGTIAVQATSDSNVSARVRKITEECADALADVREAGWTVIVMGWKKNKSGRWVCREVDLS